MYVGKPPTQHVVVGLPTCVVGGKPTTTCCCWFTNMLLEVNQQQHVVAGIYYNLHLQHLHIKEVPGFSPS